MESSAVVFWESLSQEKKESPTLKLTQKEFATKPSPTGSYLKVIGWDEVCNVIGLCNFELKGYRDLLLIR